jgi:hypothetical protein
VISTVFSAQKGGRSRVIDAQANPDHLGFPGS